MEKLHTDIAENILCRLPIETALQAKQACKTWRILLRSKTDQAGLLLAAYSPDYDKRIKNKLYYGDHTHGKINYNYTYHAFDKIDHVKFILPCLTLYGMLGSCSGLVCFRRSSQYPGEPYIVCNPITGEVVCAPKFDMSTEPVLQVSGFLYCHSTNEYKIARLYPEEARNEYHVQVYTVGSDEWRNKESVHISPFGLAGIYANGALHWLQWGHQQHKDYTIIAFDLEAEKFQFIPLLRFKDVRYNLLPNLLSGTNLYFQYASYDKPYCMDAWAYKRKDANPSKMRKKYNTTNDCDMRESYNDKNSWHWIKEFSIEWEEAYWKYLGYFAPLAITRNNELLLRYKRNTLYCYDPKTSTLNQLFDGCAIGYTMITVTPQANSIVSMNVKD